MGYYSIDNIHTGKNKCLNRVLTGFLYDYCKFKITKKSQSLQKLHL